MENPMAQLAIYLDDATAKALNAVALRDGTSRSNWVCRAIRPRRGEPDDLTGPEHPCRDNRHPR